MALFLMRMPMDMRDHIVAKNFIDCREMAEYTDRIDSGPRSKAIAAILEATTVSAVKNRGRSPSPRAEQTVTGHPAARARPALRRRAPTVTEAISAGTTPRGARR